MGLPPVAPHWDSSEPKNHSKHVGAERDEGDEWGHTSILIYYNQNKKGPASVLSESTYLGLFLN